VSHLIIKLHSDLDHPDEAVITSQDYDRILASPDGQYLRERLQQVFAMFDIFIVGHGMNDPDLQLLMRLAKYTAGPLHPIYMALNNITLAEIREFRERYNIQVISYEDKDGSHAQLRRLLGMLDRFICSRKVTISPSSSSVDMSQQEAATSLFLFRRLQVVGTSDPGCVAPLLLKVMAAASRLLTLEEIVAASPVSLLSRSPDFGQAVGTALGTLCVMGLANATDGAYGATPLGREQVARVEAERRNEEEQAIGQFLVMMRRSCPALTDKQEHAALKAIKDALISSFRARGLAMANLTLAGQSLSGDDLPDIFRSFTEQAAQFSDFDVRAAFVERAHAFIVEPNEPQKRFLAAMSQGFFLYHMANLDPNCNRVRKNLFCDTGWFIDSSVLIPLLAVGCNNHEYAIDLFRRLTDLNATLFTTEKLFVEVWRHLEWALDFVKSNSIESPEFLAAAMSAGGYKQNLFLDGYIRLAAEGSVGTFQDYLDRVCPGGMTLECLSSASEKYNICRLGVSAMTGFAQEGWGDIQELQGQIAATRKARGTFRRESQVKAEAEVLHIIRRIRASKYKLPVPVANMAKVYFVSQSRVLDIVAPDDPIVTWTPEAVYRYANSVTGDSLDPDLLQQCMLNEYFYAGVSFIDKARYLKFFGPALSQAKISYKEQVDKYLQETEQAYRRKDLDDIFDRTPDLEKPFFVAQMGWQVARVAESKAKEATQREEETRAKAQQQVVEIELAASKKIAEAEERLRAVTADAKAAREDAMAARRDKIRIQQEANRLRNLRNPKHLRKRERQAKRRARKKKR